MATIDDINSTLQNIARQLGFSAQQQGNATPAATASTSPVSYPYNNIGSASVITVIGVNATRYGLVFHNPSTTSIYVYPSAMTSVPSTTSLGGTFVIYPGGTLSFPSTMFANANGAWSAFCVTGSNQPFTVVEFL